MFVCYDCLRLEKVKVLNRSYAMLIIEMGRGSLGPCEKCKKVEVCADA